MISRAAVMATAILCVAASPCRAQSGGASLHGWVAFENVAYADKQPRAKVRLKHDPAGSSVAYSTETNEHGFFDFPHASLGRFKLEITAEGFQPYSADVYVPSDFAGNWAVELRAAKSKVAAADDASAVAALDIEYQAAVAKNDEGTMSRILAEDFVLITGTGKTFSKADLLSEARSGKTVYEHQEAGSRTVRVWGDTAVVTARLWAKGTDTGKPFEYRLWFSDTYVRSPGGWRYVLGQASQPLPKAP